MREHGEFRNDLNHRGCASRLRRPYALLFVLLILDESDRHSGATSAHVKNVRTYGVLKRRKEQLEINQHQFQNS